MHVDKNSYTVKS